MNPVMMETKTIGIFATKLAADANIHAVTFPWNDPQARSRPCKVNFGTLPGDAK